MSNMSYCRFENTSRDLMDCVDAIENNETEDLSEYEITGLRDLLEYARTIIDLEDKITEIIDNKRVIY